MDRRSNKRKHASKDTFSSEERESTSASDAVPDSDEDLSKAKRKKPSKHHKKHHRKKSHSSSSEVPIGKLISEEDYFIKSAEFRQWLSEEKDTVFNELSSLKSRKLFKKFVKYWNRGKLNDKYYRGLETADIGHTSQTKYRWKLNDVNEDELHKVSHSVGEWTHAHFAHKYTFEPIIGPSLPPGLQDRDLDTAEEEDRRVSEKARLRQERKKLREEEKVVMDELLPKATGKDAKAEKRRLRAEQRKEREVSPDVKESYLIGPSNNIKKIVADMRDKRDQKAKTAREKLTEYHEKERAKALTIMELAKLHKKEGALWR